MEDPKRPMRRMVLGNLDTDVGVKHLTLEIPVASRNKKYIEDHRSFS